MKKDCTKQDFANWLNENQEVCWIKEVSIERILSCVDDYVAICNAKSKDEFELLNDIRELFIQHITRISLPFYQVGSFKC